MRPRAASHKHKKDLLWSISLSTLGTEFATSFRTQSLSLNAVFQWLNLGIGEYLGDDRAIDGGDAEGVFAGSSSKELFAFIRQDLCTLPFMKGAKVTFVFGELEQGNPSEEFFI